MPTRKNKKPSASTSVPPSPCPSINEDDIKEEPNSEKKGRKESEQKRRVVMNQYFDELIALLTLLSQRHIPKKMDKVATLRETITCLKVYHHLTTLQPRKDKEDVLDRGDTLNLLLNAQDAFLVMVSDSGRIMFSTTLVTSLLGYIQTRLIGQNWYDYVHDQDKEIFHSLFTEASFKNGWKIPSTNVTAYKSQLCTLHLRLYPGETGGLPQFLPFKCLAYLRKWEAGDILEQDPPSPDETFGDLTASVDDQYFVILIGKLPTTLTPVDLPIGTNNVNFEFELRVSKEGRIISIEKHAILLIGYSTSEVIGTSFFDYIDPYHLSDIAESIATFAKTGLGTTTPYRMLTKSGRYIWLISKTYTSYNPWINKPDHILLTNRVLGCDQVLPEHRFYRSRKLLPDLDSEQEYTPSAHSQPSCLEVSPVPNLQQNPLVEQHGSSLSFESSSMMPQLPEVSSFLTQPFTTQPQAPVSKPQPQPPGIDLSWINFGNRPSEPMAPPNVSSNVSLNPSMPALPQSLLDIQKELERKNQEIFEMQQRLLEQQKLFEAERSQFYQVSQQVLSSLAAASPQADVKLHAPNSEPSIPKALISMSKSLSDVSMVGSPTDCSRANPNTPTTQQQAPTPRPMYDLKPPSAHYHPHSNPPTPQAAFSPYSPASNSNYPVNPSPGTPLSTQQHMSSSMYSSNPSPSAPSSTQHHMPGSMFSSNPSPSAPSSTQHHMPGSMFSSNPSPSAPSSTQHHMPGSMFSSNPSPSMPLSTEHHLPNSAVPSQTMSLTTQHRMPTTLHQQVSTFPHMDTSLGMMLNSQSQQQQFPPYLAQNSSSALPTFSQEPSSLSMHNELVCDTLGLSNSHQLGQSAAPVISHIQTLSDLFGGH